MSKSLVVLMAQINPTVGAIAANRDKIMQIIAAHDKTHDIIVFPELALSGYPPEDLLLRHDMLQQVQNALEAIAKLCKKSHVILGHPSLVDGVCFNSVSVLFRSKIKKQYHKQQLPNYGVFDEKRYFKAGPPKTCVLSIRKYRIGICICEDLWHGQAIQNLTKAKSEVIIIINASPFDHTKLALREASVRKKTQQKAIVFYVNLVGGQDELVFDGHSFVMNTENKIVARAPGFQEALHKVYISNQQVESTCVPLLEDIPMIYAALVSGLRDYVNKNKIAGVILGLSGGIDSALTLAIAGDALGSERVKAVMLPSRYSAEMSTQDAEKQLLAMNIAPLEISIEPTFKAILTSLDPILAAKNLGIVAENIQARIRAILLMALSNHSGWMLLSTSNKSETAVGFTTLYGDMCGGFAVIKDVLKTMVYELATYRNQSAPIIPERVLTREPSAELAPNQTDRDRLPDYAILDAIIQGYMEKGLSFAQLLASGLPIADIRQTLHLIKQNEYKRHQAPPGTRISPCAFGKDWRYPITQQFVESQSE